MAGKVQLGRAKFATKITANYVAVIFNFRGSFEATSASVKLSDDDGQRRVLQGRGRGGLR